LSDRFAQYAIAETAPAGVRRCHLGPLVITKKYRQAICRHDNTGSLGLAGLTSVGLGYPETILDKDNLSAMALL
jgi:hypothetical protein